MMRTISMAALLAMMAMPVFAQVVEWKSDFQNYAVGTTTSNNASNMQGKGWSSGNGTVVEMTTPDGTNKAIHVTGSLRNDNNFLQRSKTPNSDGYYDLYSQVISFDILFPITRYSTIDAGGTFTQTQVNVPLQFVVNNGGWNYLVMLNNGLSYNTNDNDKPSFNQNLQVDTWYHVALTFDMDRTSGPVSWITIQAQGGTLWKSDEIPLARYGTGTQTNQFQFQVATATVNGLSTQINFCLSNINVKEYSNVPEPATMSLLALGGLALLRRRRK